MSESKAAPISKSDTGYRKMMGQMVTDEENYDLTPEIEALINERNQALMMQQQQAAQQQESIDADRQHLHPYRMHSRINAQHPDAANKKQREADSDEREMEILEQQIVHDARAPPFFRQAIR